MGKITATKEYIKDVLGISNLRIPEYQRPYRWNDTNVRQLLEDIKSSFLSGKKHYLVGSVILHDNKKDNSFDIVDGQQRLTTLLLIQMKCSEITQKQYTPSNLTYNSNSYNCIQNNYQFLKEWFAENVNGQVEEYWHYILENCQFVKIVVDDLSEAFQMFDSQNGRGKELAAYNLLKAYHIKAMEQNSFEEKKLCDMRWEQATQYDIAPSNIQTKSLDLLDQLFGEQLYRSRLWCKKENAKRFSKKKISEFKGFTIDKNHPIQYAFQNPQLLQYLTEKFYHSVLEGTIGTQSRFATGDSENINPFVNINQAIVNGKSFFDYIETYVEIYKRMFLQVTSFQLSEFKLFYYRYCLNYNPDAVFPTDKKGVESAHNAVGYEANRTGDSFLREVYKSLVFVLFDKFGEEGLNRYYKKLYRYVYFSRIKKTAIKYATTVDLPKDCFSVIVRAQNISDLGKLDELLMHEIEEYNKETHKNKVKNGTFVLYKQGERGPLANSEKPKKERDEKIKRLIIKG